MTRRNKWSGRIGILLCLTFVLASGTQGGLAGRVSATGNTSNSTEATQDATDQTTGSGAASSNPTPTVSTYEGIVNKQNEISKIEDERKNLESGLSDLQALKKQLEQQKTSLKNYVTTLDNTLLEIEQKITNLKLQIEEKERQIQETQTELDRAQREQEERKNAMSLRMRLMYEKGDSYMTEMLLQTSNFSDFLNQADYIEKIMQYDKRVFEQLKENAEYIALCEQELEIEKLFLDEAKASVEREQENIQELITKKSYDIEQYESDISNKEQAIKEYESMIAKQNAEIEALEKAIEAERKALLENQGTVLTYDGGTFKFPLANYTRVSDDYGMRIHPTLGVEQFHNGVDFAAPAGTAIYAAYSGNVVAAAYSDTMGNYVMIDHGDGLYTIYMHASALYVSKGDSVIRGDTIAAVGTTGRSTGNHLHFSVRKGGAYVSPWNYLAF